MNEYDDTVLAWAAVRRVTPSVHFSEPEGESVRSAAAQRLIVVLKFGSSVLTCADDVPEVVSEIYRTVRTGRRVVAVVSAFAGMTDHLLTECAAAGVAHDNVNASAYVALGEETSATALALACDRAGLCAIALKAPELGIVAEGKPLDATPIALHGGRLDAALAGHDVAIVPGFVAIDASGRTVLLGRGGSDLTAVFLADKLGAERVRLLKDVDGVYEGDPAERTSARRFARLEWARAREVAGRLIQPKAIDFAATRGLTIEVACLGVSEATIIDGEGDIPALPRPRRRLRVALAGLGVVGGGVAQRLHLRSDRYEIAGALVRDPARRRDFDWSAVPLTLEPDELLALDADVIVDVLSDGLLGARLTEEALRAGVHVVSANKQAIAAGFERLREAAREGGTTLLYSAAVGGAAPILEAVRRACDSGTDIYAIEGVLSGTVNFVLDLLSEGASLDQGLAAARAAGLAEADASLDLNGADAAAKLRLIALEAFGEPLRGEHLYVEPLSGAVAGIARRVRLKQVSRLVQRGGGLRGEVVFEPAHHGPFWALGGDRNAILITGDDGRLWTARGRGAGRWPTTESVLADLADIHARPVAG
ncbi:MAG: Gfo/Idh/MocA family oxidoreductase [Vitreimonas sp.]